MSIRVKKGFEIVMREMDEMMGDIERYHPQSLSINVSGVIMDFEDVEIELNNGFMRVMDDDEIVVIKYRDVCGYSLKSFKSPRVIGLNGELLSPIVDLIGFDDLWRGLYDTPSTLPSSLLNRRVPYKEFERIVGDFIMEYEGLLEREELFDGDFIEERFMRWVRSYHTHSPSYGDLNDEMREELWEMWYPSHFLKDDCESEINYGNKWDARDYLWINDVVSLYLSDDEREFLGEWDDE